MFGHHRDRPVLTHSFPTRRSSDLIESAHADDRNVWPVGGEAQRPAFLVMELRLRLDTGADKQGMRFFEDAPLGNGECERTSHDVRSEEHTSELQSLMRISYAVSCLKKQTSPNRTGTIRDTI